MSDPTTTDIKSDTEPWSVLENLILAQAIYKCGDTNWVAIARTIKGHPQVHRSSNFFSQRSCAIQYTHLLENLEAETRSKHSRGNEAGTSATQEIPSVVKLAGQLYNQRILEIKALIRKDEERFRALVAELDEIRQGKWDGQLAEELKKNPIEADSDIVTNGTPDNNSADASQLQPDEENALADITAPSSTSSPSPTSPTEKQEDTDHAIDTTDPGSKDLASSSALAPTSTPATPSETQTGVQGSISEQESKDVEMEDVSGSTSTSETPAESNGTTAAPQTSGEDVEMEDVASNRSQSPKQENVDVTVSEDVADSSELEGSEKKQSHKDHSDSSSPTSASDLSPPGALEEEEEATNLSDPDTKAEETDAGVGLTKDEENDHETAIKTEADDQSEVEDTNEEDDSVQQKTPRIKETSADIQLDTRDSIKEDEDSKAKDEDQPNETDQNDDTAPEGAEDGATSADDEETASTKTGKKPKKIKTSIPIKRKRRSGRGGASGDHEEGYNSTDSEMTDGTNTNMSDQLLRNQMDDKKWKKILMMIWSDIANHRYGAVFMQPIKEQDAPGYYYMIKRPMDLKSIKERIRDGQITNADEFHRDVLLMFMNALMYNGEDTEVYQMALAMMTEVEFIIKNFKSSQSFAPISSSGTGGSGNTSNSTTPTTRTAAGGSDFLSAGSNQPLTRKKKSSGVEMTPVE